MTIGFVQRDVACRVTSWRAVHRVDFSIAPAASEPVGSRTTSSHIQSMCDAFEIPHVET